MSTKRSVYHYKDFIKSFAQATNSKKIVIKELEKLPQNLTTDQIIKRISKSKTLDEEIANNAFLKFIELIDVKLHESQKNKFAIPLFGTFEIKMHKGHSVLRKDKGVKTQFIIDDYQMLRFSPDDKFKDKVLGENRINKIVVQKNNNEE